METIVCPSCGAECYVEVNFCPDCGSSFREAQLVKIPVSEARVVYASRTLNEMPDSFFLAPASSEIVKTAGKHFDPSRVPEKGSLVPADCIWACFSHPGYLRPAKFGQSLLDKYKQISIYTGRTFTEMQNYFGLPEADLKENKIRSVVWSEARLSKITQIQFYFDNYDICIDVGDVLEI